MSQSGSPKRILSILPAATELCYALGVGDSLVGASHECDYPPAARKLPRVSRPRIDPGLPSGALDAQVKRLSRNGESLYELDARLIAKLRPDLVLTQVQCDVCAVSPKDLEVGLAKCATKPAVLALEAQSIESALKDALRLGKAVGRAEEARDIVFRQWHVLKQVRRQVAGLRRKRAVVLDWLDPLMFAGNWIPELVRAAGGSYDLVKPGAPSRWGRWEDLVAAEPEAIVAAPCGRSIATTKREWKMLLKANPGKAVPALEERRVFAADGNQYFNRPGPRLVYAAAILARAIHPEVPKLPKALETALRPLPT